MKIPCLHSFVVFSNLLLYDIMQFIETWCHHLSDKHRTKVIQLFQLIKLFSKFKENIFIRQMLIKNLNDVNEQVLHFLQRNLFSTVQHHHPCKSRDGGSQKHHNQFYYTLSAISYLNDPKATILSLMICWIFPLKGMLKNGCAAWKNNMSRTYWKMIFNNVIIQRQKYKRLPIN